MKKNPKSKHLLFKNEFSFFMLCIFVSKRKIMIHFILEHFLLLSSNDLLIKIILYIVDVSFLWRHFSMLIFILRNLSKVNYHYFTYIIHLYWCIGMVHQWCFLWVHEGFRVLQHQTPSLKCLVGIDLTSTPIPAANLRIHTRQMTTDNGSITFNFATANQSSAPLMTSEHFLFVIFLLFWFTY